MFGFQEDGMLADLASRIELLERLAADLRALSRGELPPAEVLQASPRLDPYSLRMINVPCLRGNVDQHPLLGGPKAIVTSPIWVVADDLAWARTYSRYYRLGRVEGTLASIH